MALDFVDMSQYAMQPDVNLFGAPAEYRSYFAPDTGSLFNVPGTSGYSALPTSLPTDYFGYPVEFPQTDLLSRIGTTLKGAVGSAGDMLSSKAGLAGLTALLSYLDRQRPHGGGAATAYAGPRQLTRTITQGKYGPVARYAANGGIMHAYAQGGSVRPFPMQDGGFVMTKRAVDGAGGHQGLQQRIPEAVPIQGPGHGTSDSIPAKIQGPHGVTPARVSNGEAYVPPGRNTQGLYALMKALERKA